MCTFLLAWRTYVRGNYCILNGGKMRVKALCLLMILIVLFILSCSNTTSPENNRPSDLQIILIENNHIKLNWQDNSSNEIKFVIDRKKGESPWFEGYDEVAENVTTFNDFIPTESDTVFSYRIRSYDGNDYSEYSIPAGWFSEQTAPTNLILEQIAQDSIKITWNDNSVGELNYKIDRKIEGEEWIESYKIIEENEEQFIDNNNELYAPCYYRISSCSGNSYSINIEGFINAFNPPTNLTAETLEILAINLEWEDNSYYEIGYKIERKKENEEYTLIDSVDQNTTSYTDNSIEAYTKYYYRIFGYNQHFNSDFSNDAHATWFNGILYVPDYYDKIQDAIDIVNSGDTIIVHPGQYNENIDFNHKNFILASDFLLTGNAEYISQTVINGVDNAPVVRLSWDLNDSTLFSGFTVTGGNTTSSGGGIYCSGAPKLSNLIVSSNYAEDDGGGIYCDGNATLEFITISNNTSWAGGGIYFDDGNPLFENSIVYNNTSIWHGGGIYISDDSQVEINKVEFSYNHSDQHHSCIDCRGEPVFRNVIITDNYGSSSVYISSSNTTFINSIFNDTSLEACNSSYVTFINCITESDNLSITDWGNGATFEISYCDMIGGQEGINIDDDGIIIWGEGNIDENPLFNGYDDYHLQANSPCIDVGNPDPQYNDYDGSRNDMGAFGGPNGEW